MTQIKLGRYQHYKGSFYEVIAIGKLEETQEDVVVYRALYGDNAVWVRKKTVFLENVTVDGNVIPRFRFVE
ncbi:DUF1653 domain-containing protein [Candidatus Woesearchaeota archaeon]|nr:DUF1653 domain-containing protein [Candidatus Woesearchaeota archaeon]